MRITYSPHPAEAYQETIYDNLVARSGRSRTDWENEARSSGIKEVKALAAWLQEEHGFGGNTASIVAAHALGEAKTPNPEALVSAMFSGKKSGLLPLYEMLMSELLPLGSDIKVCPATTIVPLYRKKVFAQIKPTTQTRIDLGLALGHLVPSGRIQPVTGAASDDRIRWRIEVRSPDEIDEELVSWASRAYEQAV